VICGLVLAVSVAVYASETDFVYIATTFNPIICDDYHNFCSGCGITCNSAGNITNIKWPSSQITYLPDTIGDLQFLVELNLHDNQLDSIPANISNLKSLKTIDLAANSFSEIPSDIVGLPALEELDMSINSISSIPTGFKALKVLSLQHNAIQDMAPLCDIASLAYVRLDNNLLPNLPECVNKMTALKLFTAAQNQLNQLPTMVNLTALKELVLAGNSFTAFPEAACAIPNLEVLDLSLNTISSVPDSCAECHISTLRLDQNDFKSFPNNLNTWENLKTLDLSKNTIEDVKLGEDEKFAVLNDLDVSFNALSCDAMEDIFKGVNILTCSSYSEEPVPPSGSESNSSESESSTSEPTGMPTWEIALIVVAGVALIAVVVFLIVYCVTKKRSRSGYESINGSR